MADELIESLKEFCKASQRGASRRHRKKIVKLLNSYWQRTCGADGFVEGIVAVPADQPYVVLHQAVQLLPGGD